MPTFLSASDRKILRIPVEGVINPIIAQHIADGIKKAETENATAVIIQLNTPGGLLDTTRNIISSMINTPVPVIVYVAPRGSRATSAGVFIAMASDVAAMAPETHIGAAHPVNIGGDSPTSKPKEKIAGNEDVMAEKMVSDAAAYIRTIATDHGRNAAWAEKAVRDSVSLTSDEALKQNVIEILATSEAELVKALNGRVIKKNGKSITLEFKDTPIIEVPLSEFRRWLQFLAHPNVAYILMMIGMYGLIYELAAPGIGLGGAIGAICLVLAFFSLQVLPINMVGVALISLGAILIALELFTVSHGLLIFGGLIAFALGSFFLIDVKEFSAYSRISLELIISTMASSALFFGIIVRKTWQARRAKPKTGTESLVGLTGEVRSKLDPEGMVFVQGELWQAEADTSIEKGTRVRVLRVAGNKIFVKKI